MSLMLLDSLNPVNYNHWQVKWMKVFIMAPVSGSDIFGIKWTFCPQSWCVRRRNNGKLRIWEFDKSHMIARHLGQSISRTVALVGCSWSVVVSIYQKRYIEGPVVNQWQGHGQTRLTDLCGEWRLAKLLKKFDCERQTGVRIHSALH